MTPDWSDLIPAGRESRETTQARELKAEVARLRELERRVRDDGLATQVAQESVDEYMDIEWVATFIRLYRNRILVGMDKEVDSDKT